MLRQTDKMNQELAFFEESSDIPTAISVAYTYPTTILTVVLATLWSLVDLESKRLEPFF